MTSAKLWIIALTALTLGACSTTQVNMNYANHNGVSYKNPVIAVNQVNDKRGIDPYYLGAVRSGFGTRLKTLKTEQPVQAVVKTTLTQGLSANGLLAKNSPKYLLDVQINKFDCSQYVRREAHVILNITLVERSSKKAVYKRTITANKVDGSRMTLKAGAFASVEDLRKVANDALQDAVDQLVQDPAFVTASKSGN